MAFKTKEMIIVVNFSDFSVLKDDYNSTRIFIDGPYTQKEGKKTINDPLQSNRKCIDRCVFI